MWQLSLRYSKIARLFPCFEARVQVLHYLLILNPTLMCSEMKQRGVMLLPDNKFSMLQQVVRLMIDVFFSYAAILIS
jgi:hypothetical protein